MPLVTEFENFFIEFDGSGAVPEEVLVCPAEKRYVIMALDICNILESGIQVDVIIHNANESKDYYLVKNAPISVGSTLQVITKQKHVLEEGDKILIFSNTVDSCHVIGSLMNAYTL